MNSKIAVMILCVAAWSGNAFAATDAAKILISESDITDRPYRVVGEISLTVKKAGVIDRPPIEEKAQIALRNKAAEMGADAVVQAKFDRRGFNFVTLGRIEVTGRAVVFLSGAEAAAAAAPRFSAPPPAPAAPLGQLSAPPPAPPQQQAQATVGLPDALSGQVRSYLEAVNAGNAGIASGMFAEDATIEDPAGSALQRGKAAVNSYVRGLVARGVTYEMVMPVRSGAGATAMAVRVAGENVILTFAFNNAGLITSVKAFGGAP